eukprot:GFUD01059850.1.p1 GENE.GFUD01059850.1~~GFUD01059850.1.p1  ORF type:complete len:154 (-),score=43.62 GFUD01059850.1:36-497(-)
MMLEMPKPCTNCIQSLCQDTLPVPQDVHPGCIVRHPELAEWKVTSSDGEGNVSLSARHEHGKENIAVSEVTYCCTSQIIKLNVVGLDDSREIYFMVKQTAKLGKFMKSYSEMVGVSMTSLRFLFDGRRVYSDETPSVLEMEEEDVIEVYLEQT